jgi:uncharacterized protein (TIGR02270 family)
MSAFFSAAEISRGKIEEIVALHAEDAALLWRLRDAALRAPHYSLTDLVKLDDRLEAHVDGVRVADELGWESIKSVAEDGAPGAVFAAGVIAFGSEDQTRIREILDLGTATPEAARGVASALGWLPYEKASKQVNSLLASADSGLARIAIAGSAIHRRNPGPALTEAITSDDLLLRARSLRASGELGVVDLQATLRRHIGSAEPACRFWAAWSCALLNGHKDAVAALQSIAEAGQAWSVRAVGMAVRRLPGPEARVWLKRLVKDLGRPRVAVKGAGAWGDPELVPWLIDQMKIPALARAAGESFSLITGARISHEDLDGEMPEDFKPPPPDDPEDAKGDDDPDRNLPWPDSARVKKWWTERAGGFSPGTRYLLGMPISLESVRHALVVGLQRQRAAAAIELALLKPGRPLFEVRAPGIRQQHLLR